VINHHKDGNNPLRGFLSGVFRIAKDVLKPAIRRFLETSYHAAMRENCEELGHARPPPFTRLSDA
jgi:hypothetical protein